MRKFIKNLLPFLSRDSHNKATAFNIFAGRQQCPCRYYAVITYRAFHYNSTHTYKAIIPYFSPVYYGIVPYRYILT